MWESKLFGSLPMLLDFVNGHALEHHQFKIAVVPPRIWQRRSGPRYYLIYRMNGEAPSATGVSAAEVDERLRVDEENAVDTASEIIHNAQHREVPKNGLDRDTRR